ncbi:XdhC Xanthine and CO dehydrogenases maturation factor, XdhC/CoxF family [Rhabdaerophilaceae bacterium]
MSSIFQHIDRALDEDLPAILVSIVDVQGSAPREKGTRMLVRADGCFAGTIGGGALEWKALNEAQGLLQRNGTARDLVFSLGPDLGQCCGGRITLRFEPLTRQHAVQDAAAENRPTPVWLFGAGHVGRALVLALAPLPFQTRWVDARTNAFPAAFPGNVTPVAAIDPLAELADLPQAALVLIMTHSHALDLAIADAALRRATAFVGVIGSATKRARFLSQLRQMGHDEASLARFCCPIGVAGLGSKDPAVIAAGLAVQLLQYRAEATTRPDMPQASHLKEAIHAQTRL